MFAVDTRSSGERQVVNKDPRGPCSVGDTLMSTVLRGLVPLAGLLTCLGGCVPVVIGEGSPPVVVTGGPRALHIPPGHCRLWYPDRPPGHQPPPVRCEQLAAGSGGFILYNGQAWDADYDWQGYARQHPGTVPRIIIELTTRR